MRTESKPTFTTPIFICHTIFLSFITVFPFCKELPVLVCMIPVSLWRRRYAPAYRDGTTIVPYRGTPHK
jgi:hypothetical protein